MLINSQRTIYGLGLQLSHMLGNPYTPLPNTTLNEKYNVLPEEKFAGTEYPSVKYYTIGVGGTEMVTGIDSYNFSKHRPTDAALFEQIPFVMKTLELDLNSDEQANYRFRVLVTLGGIQYACYYMKLIDHSDTKDNFYKVTVVDDVPKLGLFTTNTNEYLNPVPRNPTTTINNAEQTNYVTKVAKLAFRLNVQDLTNINDVLNILYGTIHNKVISEIGVCMGVDRVTESGTEAIGVQIAYHMEVNIDTVMSSKQDVEFVRSLEIGGTEPLVI